MPFGGMLGSTFNFVFETQLESAAERRPLLLPAAPRGPELRHRAGEQLVRQADHAQHRRHASAGRHVLDAGLHPRGRSRRKQFNRPADVDGRRLPIRPAASDHRLAHRAFTPLVIRDNPDTAGPGYQLPALHRRRARRARRHRRQRHPHRQRSATTRSMATAATTASKAASATTTSSAAPATTSSPTSAATTSSRAATATTSSRPATVAQQPDPRRRRQGLHHHRRRHLR